MTTTELLKRNELLLTEIDINVAMPNQLKELFQPVNWMLEMGKRCALGAVSIEEVDKLIDKLTMPVCVVRLGVIKYFDTLRAVLMETELYEWINSCEEVKYHILNRIEQVSRIFGNLPI